MEKSHLKCPGCAGSRFHLHEITIANPQSSAEAEASSAIIICSDCRAIVGSLLPPYPPPRLVFDLLSPLEGAYGEGSC